MSREGAHQRRVSLLGELSVAPVVHGMRCHQSDAAVRNGPKKLDSAVSEFFIGFQAASLLATCSKYTASGGQTERTAECDATLNFVL